MVEVVLVELVIVFDVVVVEGPWPKFCSTQYACPVMNPEQSLLTEGFYIRGTRLA